MKCNTAKIRIISILFLNLMSIIFGSRLHHYMTKREIKLLFNKDHDNMHEVKYEVVSIFYEKSERRQAKVDAKLKLEALNQKYDLYLETNKNQLFDWSTSLYIARKNFSAEKDKPNISYETKNFHSYVSTIDYNKAIEKYHDSKGRAALTVFSDQHGLPNINGMIEENVFIYPLPRSIKNNCLNNSIADFTLKSICKKSENFHIVVDMKNHSKFRQDQVNDIEKKLESYHEYEKVNNRRRSMFDYKIDTIYPELLIVVDYETYELHDKDLTKLATYMATFWNGVDLRFRQLKSPEIRFYITGLVIPTDPSLEPYMLKDSSVGDGYTYYAEKTLLSVGNYFHERFQQTKFRSYDIVVGIINKHVLSKPVKAVGYAFVGRACYGSQSVALVKDEGGYLGISVATHELGHTFGALHDGKSRDCPEKGFIMGPMVHDTIRWSNCSLKSMNNYIRVYGRCLQNKPHLDEPIIDGKKLPGKFIDRNRQCERIKPGSASINNEDCERLTCETCTFLFFGCRTIPPISPAEGSSCGNVKFCLSGKCLLDPGTFDIS